jgi:hypothetical protein
VEVDIIVHLAMNKIFNEYSLKARMFPAFLCAVPFLILKHFLIDPYLGVTLSTSLFLVVFGDISLVAVLMYLLTQINRFISKTLFEDKSNFPTAKMLLPSNKEFSVETRQNLDEKIYHDFHLNLPTLPEENANIDNVKKRIKEIVHFIINKVGGGKLLLQHNIEYGFVRNLIGGSTLAFLVSFGCSIVFGFIFKNMTAYVISTLLATAYLIPIIFSQSILMHYGKEYAEILFREYLGE